MSEVKKAGGKGKKILFAAIGAIALLGGGTAGGIYLGASKHAEPEDPRRPKLVLRSTEATAEESGEGGEDKAPPRREGTVSVASDQAPIDRTKYAVSYYPLDQSFTANLAEGSGFAQLGLSLSTYYDSRIDDNIKRQLVPIRSAILLVLSEQHAAQLSTSDGKQALQRLLTKAINQVLREREGFGGVDNVYFTSLVIQ